MVGRGVSDGGLTSIGPDWVLFKHHSLTRRLHNIIDVNVSKSMGAPKRYLHV